MKKKILIFSVLSTILLGLATGCGAEATEGKAASNQPKGVADVLSEGMAEADGNAENAGEEADDQVVAEQSDDGQTQDVVPQTEDGAIQQDGTAVAETQNTEDSVPLSTTEGIDVDLTSLSSTMVYSEVSNMLYEPENYMGKTIKMGGTLSVYHDETTGQDYYACIIADATACCSQGIEFELADGSYPPEGTEIAVVGVFDTYTENGYQYCTLRNAVAVN